LLPNVHGRLRFAAAERRSTRASAWVIAGRVAFVAGFAASLGGLSLLKYRYYLYNDIDLAMFVQALERCLHGSTFVSIRGMSWLGDHASYVLLLLAPVYALARHPVTVLLAQSLALALGVIPVQRMAARALAAEPAVQGATPPPIAAWAVVAAYLLHPALGYLGLFEFHPEVFATTALLFAIDALIRDRTRTCLAWAAVALMAREDVALVVLPLGVWAMAVHGGFRAWSAGRVLVALALVTLAATMLVIRPHFASPAAQYGAMYHALGDSPDAIAVSLLSHPLHALGLLFGTPGNPLDSSLKNELYFHLLFPFAFLSLLAPATLLVAVPVLAEHLLSERTQQHTILFQYSALLLPVLVWSAAEALGRISRWDRRVAHAGAVLMLVCAAIAQVMYGPLGLGRVQSARATERVLPDDRDRFEAPVRDRMLAQLPSSGGVIAGFEFLPRLTQRDDVYSLHHVLSGTYTYSSEPYPAPDQVAAVLADWSHPRLRSYLVSPEAGRRIGRVIAVHDLVPVEAVGDLVRFGSGEPALPLLTLRSDVVEAPVFARFDGVLEFLGADVAATLDTTSGTVSVTTAWRRVASTDGVYLMRLDVVDESGRVVTTHTRVLGYVVWPVADWTLDGVIVERYAFAPGVPLSPGRYAVRMDVARLGSTAPLQVEVVTPDPGSLGSFVVDPKPS
jgi:uncharacterized membrane protein